MSETGDIGVLVPLDHWPTTRADMQSVIKAAFRSAREFIAANGGRLIGLSRIARAETLDGRLALRATFRAEAPEAAWPTKRIF